MVTPTQADADPVAVVIDWLKGAPEVGVLLGGPERVSGQSEAPWPHLAVFDGPGGDLRDMRWDAEYEVSLELTGSPDNVEGDAALRRIMLGILAVVAHLPEEQVVYATTPVVSRVRPSGTYGWADMPSTQRRITSGVYVTIRPPSVVPVS